MRSLLLSVAVLLIGHGLQLTLLPLQAQKLGWSDAAVGFTGSAYYLGFIIGCLSITRVIARVGHIRTFAVTVATATIAILGLALTDTYLLWLLLRLLTGWSLAGFYTVIESWLNDQAANEQRGRLLALYTIICLGSMALGQMLIGLDGVTLAELFPVAGMLIVGATLPVALTTRPQPAPPVQVTFSAGVAYRASQVGFVSAGLSGLVMGLLWSLGAVHVADVSGSIETGARFMLAVLLGGLLVQFPAGRLSDRFDRRRVILGLGVLGTVGVALWFFAPANDGVLYAAGVLCGGAAQPLYSISIAHANDNASGQFIEISSGMLMVNGCCAMLGPFLFSLLRAVGVEQAFMTTIAVAFTVCIVWTAMRMRTHAVTRDHFEPYQPLPKTALEVVELHTKLESEDPRLDASEDPANER